MTTSATTPAAVPVMIRATAEAHSYLEPDTGAWVTVDCSQCGLALDEGDPIVKHAGHGWVHVHCLAERITAMEPDAAWLTLGEQIAATPGRFRAGEIRAVMRHVLRIARARQP